MKFSIKKLPKSKVEILFEIPAGEFNNFVEKAVFNLGKDLEVEGFRKGRVPKEIIIRTIGQEKILKEAKEIAAKENYLKVISENKIEVLGQPEIEVLPSQEEMIFKALVSILPMINLPDYKKIASEVKRNKVSAEEKEIEAAILWLQKSRAKFILKSEPCQKGDFVEIAYSSPFIEGEKEFKDRFILGEGHFIPDFEKNLEGMKNGQEKEFSIKIPKNHSEKKIADKLIDFKVRMVSIQKAELPEISDQWVRDLGKFENLASLKNNIKEGLISEKEIAESERVRQDILEKISQNSSLEIPEILIKTEKERILEELKEKVSQILQVSFGDYLNKIKKSEEELKESFSENAKRRIKDSLLLREIAIREEFGVPEEEIKERTNQLLKKYPIERTKELDLEKLKSYYEEAIRNEKTLKFLEELVK